MNKITCYNDSSYTYETELKYIGKGIWSLYLGQVSVILGTTHEQRQDRNFMIKNQKYLTDEQRKKSIAYLNVAYPTLGKKGLQQYISILEILLTTQPKYVEGQYYDIEWENNEADIKTYTSYYDFEGSDEYNVTFIFLQKYHANFEGEDHWGEYAIQDTGEYDKSRYPSLDSGQMVGPALKKDMLEKYIKDLIAEYEKITGKTYIRIEVPFKERD